MSVLPSKKQGLHYIERCRVMAKDERLVYAMQEGGFTKFFSIPDANTNAVLLGSGTSITQPAARIMSEEGIMLGFVGGGGTPLYLASQNEYRPSQYLQSWIQLWSDESKRLSSAKKVQIFRLRFLISTYEALEGIKPKQDEIERAAEKYGEQLLKAKDTSQLLGYEANFAKDLYRAWAKACKINFVREPGKKDASDLANSYLDHGNYLAYGLAAVSLWVLGIPHSLPLMHGKTRRGGLVFDIADIVKDATIMPIAFQSAAKRIPDNQMRGHCVSWLDQSNALEFIFDSLKELCIFP